MSRIGKRPIKIQKEVSVNVQKDSVSVVGPYGSLERSIPPQLSILLKDDNILVKTTSNLKQTRSLQGLFRTLLQNMLQGVRERFLIELELNGVGYRCQITNNKLSLSLGFSHPIELVIPQGIEVRVESNTNIQIFGSDKEKVGFFASKIRDYRPPEPYNGKGVLYKSEIIFRKAGKAGKK